HPSLDPIVDAGAAPDAWLCACRLVVGGDRPSAIGGCRAATRLLAGKLLLAVGLLGRPERLALAAPPRGVGQPRLDGQVALIERLLELRPACLDHLAGLGVVHGDVYAEPGPLQTDP